MEFTEDFADDFGALARGPVRRQAHLVHAEKYAAMHRLEAIPDIGKGAAHDHAHRVIEVRALHLVFDIDGYHRATVRVGGLARIAWRRRFWGWWWTLCGVILICHVFRGLSIYFSRKLGVIKGLPGQGKCGGFGQGLRIFRVLVAGKWALRVPKWVRDGINISKGWSFVLLEIHGLASHFLFFGRRGGAGSAGNVVFLVSDSTLAQYVKKSGWADRANMRYVAEEAPFTILLRLT